MKRIRQQQQAEIRKLRREGSIARSAYYTSDDEDSSGEGQCTNAAIKDSPFSSVDEVDGTQLQRLAVTSLVKPPHKTDEHTKRSLSRNGISTPENQSATEDDATEINNEIKEDNEQSLKGEQTDDSDALPRTTKWVEDTGETEEDDSVDDEESSSTANLSCLTRVVVGLLEMLEEVLRCASDTTARTLLAESLHMDQTLIMANHPHPVIRQAVLKVSLGVWRRTE